MKKISKHYHTYFYIFLMSIPLMYVLFITLYVICNKNAYQSFDSTIGTLDNTFNYVINSIITDYACEVDFFQWFVDIFFQDSNIYIEFVNWYLNYAMLISLGFLLFTFLYVFVDFARKCLYKFTSTFDD